MNSFFLLLFLLTQFDNLCSSYQTENDLTRLVDTVVAEAVNANDPMEVPDQTINRGPFEVKIFNTLITGLKSFVRTGGLDAEGTDNPNVIYADFDGSVSNMMTTSEAKISAFNLGPVFRITSTTKLVKFHAYLKLDLEEAGFEASCDRVETTKIIGYDLKIESPGFIFGSLATQFGRILRSVFSSLESSSVESKICDALNQALKGRLIAQPSMDSWI